MVQLPLETPYHVSSTKGTIDYFGILYMPVGLSAAVLVAVISSPFGRVSVAQRTGDSKNVVAYASVREKLTKETQVPLHLPTFVPFSDDSSYPVFAILDSTDSRSYKIQLAWSGDCKGGNWCHLGSIQGSISPISAEGRRIPVSFKRRGSWLFRQVALLRLLHRSYDPVEPGWSPLCNWDQSWRREDPSKDGQFRHKVDPYSGRPHSRWGSR